MARGKTVVRQTLVAEAGIALIHKRVTEMGYLFHPRRVDHGIDGHIDLVDPGTREVLNLVLLVQSKASGLRFPYETESSFQYTCAEADLTYWLSGNAPVMLILSHPDQDEAWWVDIKAEFADARRRAERTVLVDKRRQVFDATAAAHLLRMAVPKDSGLFLASPPKRETLTSNLLPVADMPGVIYLAPAAATTYPAAGELLASQQRTSSAAWILRDGMVVSFEDLTDGPLGVLCAGDVERHETTEWAASDDLDAQYRFMDLLARALAADHRGDLRWHNDRKHLHFLPTRTLDPRREGKVPGRRGHTVFGPYRSKRSPDVISFYKHAALRSRFRRFGGTWYCQLSPDYCFTSDGREEYQYADTLLAGIKRLDRHAPVAGWTRSWATYLTKQADLFAREKALVFGELVTFEVDSGIDDRLWGPAPGTTVTSVSVSQSNSPPATMRSSSASRTSTTSWGPAPGGLSILWASVLTKSPTCSSVQSPFRTSHANAGIDATGQGALLLAVVAGLVVTAPATVPDPVVIQNAWTRRCLDQHYAPGPTTTVYSYPCHRQSNPPGNQQRGGQPALRCRSSIRCISSAARSTYSVGVP